MNLKDKLAYIQIHHFGAWIDMRRKVFDELSERQSLLCTCGRLATGLHEMGCRKFNALVSAETVKRLDHLIEKPKCVWVPCKEEAKHLESNGRGMLVHVCTPHRRWLRKQKLVNNNI